MINFSIPITPPSLNTVLRVHWAVRSKLQKQWDEWIYFYWREMGSPVITRPVNLFYTLSFPRLASRDIDNYIGGTKFATDALKRTFITRDDYLWLQSVLVRFQRGPKKTDIVIKEVD